MSMATIVQKERKGARDQSSKKKYIRGFIIRARTVCNYLMDAIEDCGNGTMEDGCTTEEAVTEMKDTQLSKVLENIGQSIADFDSCKCPPVKAHLNRMKAAEGAKFVQECYDDYGMAAGATNCFISVLFVPLLVLRYMY